MSGSTEHLKHFQWRPLPQSYRDEAARCRQAVLLEASRRSPDAKSYLFTNPTTVLEPHSVSELREMFKRMDAETARGRWVAGYVAYEAGHAFEPKLAPLLEEGQRLAWIGIFSAVTVFDHASPGEHERYSPSDAITDSVPKLSEAHKVIRKK